MTPPHPFHQLGQSIFRAGGSGWVSGLSTFFFGAMAAGVVISLIKQGEPRITGAVRKKESAEGKSLDELIAEKEHLEDMIAEAAAKGKG